jgi:hypothetical protein
VIWAIRRARPDFVYSGPAAAFFEKQGVANKNESPDSDSAGEHDPIPSI